MINLARRSDQLGSIKAEIVHAGDECVHIVRGTVEVHVGDRAIRLSAGDTITYDATVPHWWRNVGGSEAEVISACAPPSF